MTNNATLVALEQTIQARLLNAPQDSYVAALAKTGKNRIAQKVGEEAVELALASVSETREAIIGEAADLLFHTLLLLNFHDIQLADVVAELAERAESMQRATSE